MINKSKTKIITFNTKKKTQETEDIKVEKHTDYLIVMIIDKKELFKQQKDNMII